MEVVVDLHVRAQPLISFTVDVLVLLASSRSGPPSLRRYQRKTVGRQHGLCPSRNAQRTAAAPRSNTQQSSQRRQLAMASSLINAPRGGETGGTINRILSTSRYLNTGGRQSFLGTSTATSFSLGKLEHAKLLQSALNGRMKGHNVPQLRSWFTASANALYRTLFRTSRRGTTTRRHQSRCQRQRGRSSTSSPPWS